VNDHANTPDGPEGTAPRASFSSRRPTDDPRRFLIPEAHVPPGFAALVDAPPHRVAQPRPAATVVLAREAEQGPEVLLLLRHNRSGFAADAWVFPGGVVDAADGDPALPVLCDGPSPDQWAARLGLEDAMEAFGYAVSAVREAFEETGILLARKTMGGEHLGGADLPRQVLREHRERLLAGETTLREIAAAAGIQLSLDRLTYVAHWITPEPEPRRYDTRFFLAHVPADVECMVHEPELVEARWMAPSRAVDGFRTGGLKMLPPTVHTLRRLAEFGTVAQMQDSLAHAPVPAILPRMRRHPEGIAIEF
jgi:8-oxo-dGTP pyrophosphatase MutT (NUDIX family)